MIREGDSVAAALFVDKVPELRTMPVVAQRAVRLAHDANSTTTQLAECISLDPALASTVLRHANSAFYGAREPIRDIVSAIIMLGFRPVCELAVAASLQAVDTSDPEAEARWRRTLAVATTASRMACEIFDHRGSGETFVAGLLHDIGKVALRRARPDTYDRCFANRLSEEDGYALCCALLGFHPGDLGAAIARAWSLGHEIADCAQYHAVSDALTQGRVTGEGAVLLWIIQGAKLIAYQAFDRIPGEAAEVRLSWLCCGAPTDLIARDRYESAWCAVRDKIVRAVAPPARPT
ncbi:MAG: HDOD domain-containing protein [Deltaproteobacteria bacterium]|nr:HDOD domain-containing protein [Deltaproteobacteria bacterium]